jgi:predicted phage-related endonuclease
MFSSRVGLSFCHVARLLCNQRGPEFGRFRLDIPALQYENPAFSSKRRHLTADQKAAIAVALLPLLEREAKNRQATSTGGAKPQLKANLPEAEKGQARDKAAELVGVSSRYVSDFKKIQATKPELAEKIRKGKKRLHEAVCAGTPYTHRITI